MTAPDHVIELLKTSCANWGIHTWHFGMKAHIGVDVASGLVHMVVGTAANEADISQIASLLHGQEEAVFGPREGGDAGYTGAEKRPELEDRDVDWNSLHLAPASIISRPTSGLRLWLITSFSSPASSRPDTNAASQLRPPANTGLQRRALIRPNDTIFAIIRSLNSGRIAPSAFKLF